MISKLMGISLIPIMVLNILGGIIGAIWLLFLGEWRLVLIGILIDVVFSFAYGLIMMLQMPLVFLLNYLQQKNKKTLLMVTGFINLLISNGINLIWVILAFTVLLNFAKGGNEIPYLLFGWELATGPFQYMASQESSDSTATHVGLYLTQISYLVLAVSYLLGVLWLSFPIIILTTLALVIYLLRIAHGDLNR